VQGGTQKPAVGDLAIGFANILNEQCTEGGVSQDLTCVDCQWEIG
jgi:hypothetical protein